MKRDVIFALMPCMDAANEMDARKADEIREELKLDITRQDVIRESDQGIEIVLD